MQWENEWDGEILFSHGSPNSCGRAILIRNNTNYSVLSTTQDPLGRFITLKIQIDGKAYVLVNIYVPTKDKDLRACFHGGGGPQEGEVTCLGGVTRLSI